MCKTIIEDAEDILDALPDDMEASLPTWWTNKLAKVSAYDERCSRLFSIKQTICLRKITDRTPCMAGSSKVGDYQSKHFDICPSAVALYKDIEPTEEDRVRYAS